MSAVAEAIATARHDLLVTIGIAPSHPAMVFGYIQLGDNPNISDAPNASGELVQREARRAHCCCIPGQRKLPLERWRVRRQGAVPYGSLARVRAGARGGVGDDRREVGR